MHGVRLEAEVAAVHRDGARRGPGASVVGEPLAGRRRVRERRLAVEVAVPRDVVALVQDRKRGRVRGSDVGARLVGEVGGGADSGAALVPPLEVNLAEVAVAHAEIDVDRFGQRVFLPEEYRMADRLDVVDLLHVAFDVEVPAICLEVPAILYGRDAAAQLHAALAVHRCGIVRDRTGHDGVSVEAAAAPEDRPGERHAGRGHHAVVRTHVRVDEVAIRGVLRIELALVRIRAGGTRLRYLEVDARHVADGGWRGDVHGVVREAELPGEAGGVAVQRHLHVGSRGAHDGEVAATRERAGERARRGEAGERERGAGGDVDVGGHVIGHVGLGHRGVRRDGNRGGGRGEHARHERADCF